MVNFEENLIFEWKHQSLQNFIWISSGIILCMRPANERRRYMVMSSLIGWVQTQNDSWNIIPNIAKYFAGLQASSQQCWKEAHDDVKWKPFPRYWPFVWGIHKWVGKQWWGWWFETPLCPLWRHYDERSASHWFLCYWLACCPACRTFFDRNKILSGGDLSHYQVPHCIRVFFYFVWFVFIHHNFQFYFKLCTYCNILDIYLS